jgi:hypothetical protein
MSFGCTGACKRPAGNQCHCTGCHQTFRHLGDFEAHRRGSVDQRYCLNLAGSGLVEVDGIWASPESHEQARRTTLRLADSRTSPRGTERSERSAVGTDKGEVA